MATRKAGGLAGAPPSVRIAQYNATITAIQKSTGVSRKEAQQTYRDAATRLGRIPTARDAKSAATKKEAAAAGGRIAAARRAKERRIERITERVRKVPDRVQKAREKLKVVISPPKAGKRRGGPEKRVPGPSGGGMGGGGGGSGAGGRGRGREEPMAEDYDYIGIEPPDEISGEEGDYPEGA